MPWRLLFAGGAIALLVLVAVMIRDNLLVDALVVAVRDGDIEEIERVLATDPSLIATPVYRQGSRSQDATQRGRRWAGRTLLHDALLFGSVDVAETLRRHGAALTGRIEGDTLLHDAAERGDVEMMRWLLQHGADADARNGCEHPAAAVCLSGPLAELTPNPTADASIGTCAECQHEGRTPLHAASMPNIAEAVALLLAHGADVNAIDARGRTPLHVAASTGSGEASRVLCAHGADPAALDGNGKTPEQLAREADVEAPDRAFTATGPGEVADWLAPRGGCATVAARARAAGPVPEEEANAAWRGFVCGRDPGNVACQR